MWPVPTQFAPLRCGRDSQRRGCVLPRKNSSSFVALRRAAPSLCRVYGDPPLPCATKRYQTQPEDAKSWVNSSPFVAMCCRPATLCRGFAGLTQCYVAGRRKFTTFISISSMYGKFLKINYVPNSSWLRQASGTGPLSPG